MSLLTAFLLIPIALCINIYDNDKISRSRIINGEAVSANMYPWMVSLRLDLNYEYDGKPYTYTSSFCGGSLIQLSPPVILSAAHCLNDFIFSDIDNSVRIDINGTIYIIELYADINRTYPEILQDSFQTLAIYGENVYIHEQYNENTVGNDIALLIFNNNYDIYIHPLPTLLSSLNYQDGTECCYNNEELIIIGYGWITENGTKPYMLQMTKLKYIPTQTCIDMNLQYTLQYNNITNGTADEMQWIKQTYFQRYFQSELICVVGDNTDACFGDSGGPLFRFNKYNIPELIGVASFVTGGCNTGSPTVYTNVATYYNWIMETIKPTECEPEMRETEQIWFIVAIVFICFSIVLIVVIGVLGYMLYTKSAKTKKVSDGKGRYVQNGNEYVENGTLKNTIVVTECDELQGSIK